MRETTRRRMWSSMRHCIARSFRFELEPRLLRDPSARHFASAFLPLAFFHLSSRPPLHHPLCWSTVQSCYLFLLFFLLFVFSFFFLFFFFLVAVELNRKQDEICWRVRRMQFSLVTFIHRFSFSFLSSFFFFSARFYFLLIFACICGSVVLWFFSFVVPSFLSSLLLFPRDRGRANEWIFIFTRHVP